jgi:hypothetical protein
MTALVL